MKRSKIFLSPYKKNVAMLFRIKGTLAGKDITISIAPAERNNYISIELANHLVILESNIREELEFWTKNELK